MTGQPAYTDADVPTLTEFLLARIAEDEAVARAAVTKADPTWEYESRLGNLWTVDNDPDRIIDMPALRSPLGDHIARHDPARVLAECEAKRRIVAIHHPHEHHGEHGAYAFCDACQWDHGDDSPRIDMGIEEFGKTCPTLRALAAVYADHPDYRDEWRP